MPCEEQRKGPQGRQAAQPQASYRSLEAGGLPPNVLERLQRQAAEQGTPSHLFTSTLSVDELSLVGRMGSELLGQVMGSAVYHVGWQLPRSWTGISGELTKLTQAFYQARHLALGRLQ